MPVRIGELLLKEKRITPDQLQQALDHQKASGGKLGFNLVKMGFVKDEEITALLSKQYGVPSINLAQFDIDAAVIKLIPAETAQKYQIIPLSRAGATLTIAMTDPTNVFAMDDIKFMTGYNVEPVVASEIAIIEAIQKSYPAAAKIAAGKAAAPVKEPGQSLPNVSTLEIATKGLEELQASLDTDASDVEVLEELQEISADALARQGEEAPVVRLVNVVLMSAIQKGASDIHIEPYEKELRVRYRIDGMLYNIMSPPMKFRDAISSRIKIMSKLDIAEKRLPQDGRIKIRFNEHGTQKEIDFRVSVLPTLFGEKIVMRLLDKDKLMLDMTRLGFEAESLAKFETAILRPWGMVLVTGPTGSGKTNTLYSSIAKINTPETNIMTAEDPVEFNLAGINQVQVKESIGLNFAAALRSFLRQDPNIILVGEIRDFETAEIAVKAALTGHLVLVDAAHQRRAEHDQPADEHGHRAVPGRQLGPSDLRAAPRPPRLLELQGAGAAAAARAGAGRLLGRAGQRGDADEGQGLRSLQPDRLQGPRRPLRSHGDRRGAARADSGRRVGARAAPQGGRRRDDHASPERPAGR